MIDVSVKSCLLIREHLFDNILFIAYATPSPKLTSYSSELKHLENRLNAAKMSPSRLETKDDPTTIVSASSNDRFRLKSALSFDRYDNKYETDKYSSENKYLDKYSTDKYALEDKKYDLNKDKDYNKYNSYDDSHSLLLRHHRSSTSGYDVDLPSKRLNDHHQTDLPLITSNHSTKIDSSYASILDKNPSVAFLDKSNCLSLIFLFDR